MVDTADPDPPLPLISNVVSLSDAAAFSGAAAEVEELTATEEEATNLSVESNTRNSSNNNTRRATLRLKRGIELSFEVDQNGQPISATDAATSASAMDHSGSPRLVLFLTLVFRSKIIFDSLIVNEHDMKMTIRLVQIRCLTKWIYPKWTLKGRLACWPKFKRTFELCVLWPSKGKKSGTTSSN